MKKIIGLLIILSISTSFNNSYAQWEKVLMPGSRGGAVHSICFKDSLLFAGIKGGVYVSSDDGDTWEKVNPDLPPRQYDAVVFSLAFAGEKLIAAFNEPGVYLSSDGGYNWNLAEIYESPRRTPFEIAANENFIIGGNFSGNTYKSFDNGLTWETDTLADVSSFAVKDSFILAQSYLYDREGIYLSTNYGSTWTKVNSLPYHTNSNGWRSAILFSDSLVFAGINSFSQAYILRSSDNGFTWFDNSYLNCTNIYSIVKSSIDSLNNFVFAGTDSGLYRSTDYGKTWLLKNNGINSNFILSLAFNEAGSILYAGTGDGIFSSSDYGETWNPVGTPSEWIFTSSGSDIFAASSNEEYMIQYDKNKTTIYHSSDNGGTWENKFAGYLHNNSKIKSIDVQNHNEDINLYAVIEGFDEDLSLGLVRTIIFSDDLGSSWEKIYSDVINGYIVLKTYSSTVFISEFPGGNIFRTIDFGENWLKVADSTGINSFSTTINEDKIYAGSSDIFLHLPGTRPPKLKLVNTLLFSSDKGSTWTKISSSIDSAKIIKDESMDTLSFTTCIHAKDSHLLVGMRAYKFYDYPPTQPANGGILHHLIQNGEEWAIQDSSFIGTSVFAFESNNNDIYAATDTGLFRSLDYGSTWTDISLGMKNIYVSSLFKSDDYLYANTINGVWKIPLSQITSVDDDETGGEIPNHFSLEQNYPNPFNPNTTINYNLAANSLVTLKIYDILGREIQTLVNEFKIAGKHSVVFNAGNLPSGVYFYKIQAGNFSETKKLILLK